MLPPSYFYFTLEHWEANLVLQLSASGNASKVECANVNNSSFTYKNRKRHRLTCWFIPYSCRLEFTSSLELTVDKLKLSLCLIKHNAMKTYDAAEVHLHALLTMILDKDKYTAWRFGRFMPQFSVDMNYSKLSSKEKSSSFVFFLFGDSLASEFYVPTFRSTLSSICLVLTTFMTMGQSVPKRRHIKFGHKRKNTTFDVHRAVHRNILSIVKPTRCTNVSNLFYFILFYLEWQSTCFGRSFRPSSRLQDCKYSNRHLSNCKSRDG